tara:strand:+ start:382 stop:585 length:204 start_codon:yes stop_codon:yes gene_type:complete
MNIDKLTELAIKKGFKKGSIINASWLNPNCRAMDSIFEYYKDSDCLFFGAVPIYEKGKWASINNIKQ